MKKINIKNLELISYDKAMEIMKDLHQRRCDDIISDTLLVLQHHPVITKGRRMHQMDVPFHPEIEKRGIQVRNADRGGLLTYHGPGQIVVYFIVKFSNYFDGISQMVQRIEHVLQSFLKQNQVITTLDPEHPGIWVGNKKIASIGLRVSKGITTHGIALNISNDLEVYKYFNPCGMSGETMTNLRKICKINYSAMEVEEFSIELANKFVCEFQEKSKIQNPKSKIFQSRKNPWDLLF